MSIANVILNRSNLALTHLAPVVTSVLSVVWLAKTPGLGLPIDTILKLPQRCNILEIKLRNCHILCYDMLTFYLKIVNINQSDILEIV